VDTPQDDISENGVAHARVSQLWDSLDSIRQFSGENLELAVVEPEARAVLSTFDDFVRHYAVEGSATCQRGTEVQQ
jgi:hypothetical protein